MGHVFSEGSRPSTWARVRIALGIAGVALAGCRQRGAAVDEWRRSREEARATLRQHCGACHIASLSTALPQALAIYNLEEADWPARMSEAQLRSAAWRLDETLHQLMPGHPRPDAGSGSPLDWPNDISAADRQRFRHFVDLELKHRAETMDERPR